MSTRIPAKFTTYIMHDLEIVYSHDLKLSQFVCCKNFGFTGCGKMCKFVFLPRKELKNNERRNNATVFCFLATQLAEEIQKERKLLN